MGWRVGPLPGNFPSNASSNDEREPVPSSATKNRTIAETFNSGYKEARATRVLHRDLMRAIS